MKDLLRAGPVLQMGWVVALSVLIPIGVGLLLDRRFGTAPLLTLAGALLGILTSTVAAVRITTQAIEALAQPLPDKPETGEPVPGVDPGRKED